MSSLLRNVCWLSSVAVAWALIPRLRTHFRSRNGTEADHFSFICDTQSQEQLKKEWLGPRKNIARQWEKLGPKKRV